MKIILLEKVVNLGELGDIVEVANGYARNYLVPQGMAKRATKDSMAEFESSKAAYQKKQDDILAEARTRQTELEGKLFEIIVKAGVDGKLFGSVTSFDIVDIVNKNGYNLKKSEISMPNGSIKNIGQFDVQIILHHDVHTSIRLNVVAQST